MFSPFGIQVHSTVTAYRPPPHTTHTNRTREKRNGGAFALLNTNTEHCTAVPVWCMVNMNMVDGHHTLCITCCHLSSQAGGTPETWPGFCPRHPPRRRSLPRAAGGDARGRAARGASRVHGALELKGYHTRRTQREARPRRVPARQGWTRRARR